MSAPDSTPNARTPLLPPQAVKVLAIAFAAGLLLFLLVWLKSRHHYDFYKADGTDASASQTSTLPAPLPPDLASGDGNPGSNASGLSLPKDGTVAAPPPPARPPAPHPPTAPPPATAPPATTPVINDAVAQRSPAPRYPQAALRRGVGGTVKVLANVAPDGSVAKVEVAEGSGNRDLDRAALDAVRRWQFKPATRNGQPVASEVRVPIVFSPVR